MFKIALIATFTATTAFAAMAGTTPVQRDMGLLSPEQQAQVIRLETYGHRFDKAIDAIFTEAGMQDVRWSGSEVEAASSPRDLSLLTPEVRAHVVKLMSYGHRYDKAVDAIFHAAAMQEYGWGDCGLGETGSANDLSPLPAS